MNAFFGVVLVLLGTISAQAQKASGTQLPEAPASTRPKVDAAKEADILQLMDVIGAKALLSGQMETMGASMKPLLTRALPPGEYREQLVTLFFAKFKSEADVQKLIDLTVPIYDKYLSDQDVKGLIVFYQTPLGQKAIHAMPQVMTESSEEGRKWGEGLGKQSMIDVLSEHPELAEALKKARNQAGPQ
jgi:hypothetical protein